MNKTLDNQLIWEAYVDTSKFENFWGLDSDVQDALSAIAQNFQISNLRANMWERDAMAAAFQYGMERAEFIRQYTAIHGPK